MATSGQAFQSSHGEKRDSVEANIVSGGTVSNAAVGIRLGFLRKVYGILCCQLSLTVLVCLAVVSNEKLAFTIRHNQGIVLLSCFGAIGLLIALLFQRQNYPINFYLLTAFTFLESISVASIVTFYHVNSVLKAAFLTATIFIALTLYTMQSTNDFSTWGACLFTAVYVLIASYFLQIFFPSRQMELLLSIGGALLFCGFIIFDTHLLMHKLSPEEYILATINLYLDIINLFLYLLRLVGDRK